MIHPRFAHQTHLKDFLGHLQLACLFQDFFKRYPGFCFFDMCGFFFSKQMVGDQNDGSALCTKLVKESSWKVKYGRFLLTLIIPTLNCVQSQFPPHLGRFYEIVHVRDSLVVGSSATKPKGALQNQKDRRKWWHFWKCWGNSLMKQRKKEYSLILKMISEVFPWNRNDMGLLWSFYAWAQRPSALYSKRYSRALRLTPQ